MVISEHLIEKIKSLPEDKIVEVIDFIEFLVGKSKGQTELSEYGMEEYLTQILTYEEMLANGKIKWS